MSVFIDNKYLQWYLKIVIDAKIRNDTTLVHHHIFPKSYFTKYASLKKHPWNGAYVTEREHFICHWLLVKCTAGKLNRSMRFAMHCMLNGSGCYENYIPCSRIYVLAQRSTKRTHSEETKEKCRQNANGFKKGHTPWNKGKTKGDPEISKMYEGRRSNDSWKKNFLNRSPEVEKKRLKSVSRPVMVEGIRYDSAREAWRTLSNIKYITLVKRIKSKNFSTWYYV